MSANNRRKVTNSFSYGEFVWWMGVVEDRNDPDQMGRVRVRIHGYHSDDTSDVPKDKLPWAMVVLPTTSAAVSGFGQSPTALLQGSKVIGFFADGHDAQVPIVVGSLPAKPAKVNSQGFKDPDGKYPKYPEGEQDCNRVATNRKIGETCIQKRKSDVDRGVKVAFGGSWSEPTTPYAAKYPYNQVYESESGHMVEFDDTKGSERYCHWHPKGNFTEVHPDGTEVHKIKKDGYEITYGNEFVHIKGNCNVTIDGNSNVKIGGNANIEISGNCKEKIGGNYELTVSGNMTTKVGGTIRETAGSSATYRAPRININ